MMYNHLQVSTPYMTNSYQFALSMWKTESGKIKLMFFYLW